MAPPAPSLHPKRLVALMQSAVDRCRLDLSGAVVLTEAASGPYVVTPLLAALAGADKVFALARTTRYGSSEDVASQTCEFVHLLGLRGRIEIVSEKSPDVLRQADIVTNSGHLRPLDAPTIRAMKPTAVIPLMYEAWELRPGDVDLDECRALGIRVAGTNECHPAIDVFSFLGMMAVKLLTDSGIAVYGSRILLLCDNPFATFLRNSLEQAGAIVELRNVLPVVDEPQYHDAILVALRPMGRPQFWGDVDRAALAEADVPVTPVNAPSVGHMGVLPSSIGPEPVVRLQAGGLKVGEVLSKWSAATEEERAFTQLL
ncbi:MAG: hypothetical protein DMF91_00415 [Acidobacteria bacterium]|nr:MAG: hypothetical protein DMF91_00415 [Acidobacteriota bacterium]